MSEMFNSLLTIFVSVFILNLLFFLASFLATLLMFTTVFLLVLLSLLLGSIWTHEMSKHVHFDEYSMNVFLDDILYLILPYKRYSL